VKELMRMKWEIIIILIGLLVMWNMGAIGQMQKIVVTAVTVAIAMVLAFKASKKFGAPKIEWEVVSEDTKVYFRLGIIIAFVFAYAIISNSFAVRIG
jgi:Kef-type K+ transport system membrane component KefB